MCFFHAFFTKRKGGNVGKSYYVPGDISYGEWEERFVDREEYEDYKKVLGKNAPKSLAEFQNWKYNDSEGWEDLKYYYKNINGRPIEYVKIDRELEKLGIKGKGKAYPVESIKIEGWRVHAENRLNQRTSIKLY